MTGMCRVWQTRQMAIAVSIRRALCCLLLPVCSHVAVAGQQFIDLADYAVSGFILGYDPSADLVISNRMPDEDFDEDYTSPVRVSLGCEQSWQVHQGGRWRVQDGMLHRSLGHADEGDARIVLRPGPANDCTLSYADYRIRLLPEAQVWPAAQDFFNEDLWCGNAGDGVAVDFLKEPHASLSARFEALFGYPLSREAWLDKDPDMAIDLERLPPLDLVILDTLQLLDDFVGRIMLRGLAAHARRGARVILITSSALAISREPKLFHEFRANNPLVSFEEYRAPEPDEDAPGMLPDYHRSNHIKVMLTWSQADSAYNRLIAGGRNISEMYFYPEMPDNSDYPQIVQWDEEFGYGWGYFDDLDFVTRDLELMQQVGREVLAFHRRDYRALASSDDILLHNSPRVKNANFFNAIPSGLHGSDLEANFVRLIDSAKRRLEIYTPYVNPPPAIEAALDRAVARGVELMILTNITLDNDFMPEVVMPAALRAYRRLIHKYPFVFYRRPRSTMHIKAIVIDDASLVLGSVNLNHRSFLHDTEFVLHLYDAGAVNDFRSMARREIEPYTFTIEGEDELPEKSIMENIVAPLMEYF